MAQHIAEVESRETLDAMAVQYKSEKDPRKRLRIWRELCRQLREHIDNHGFASLDNFTIP